jgi:uncharacterized protein (TIGR02646 family)
MADGKDKQVSKYTQWRKDMINNYGYYCAYCNMPLKHSLQVEHVQPKSLEPSLALRWDNLVLACGPCNVVKSNQLVSSKTHYLPDVHNTHMLYTFPPDGTATVKHGLRPAQRAKALRTLNLVKLDGKPTGVEATDLRQDLRKEVHEIAEEVLDDYLALANTRAARLIGRTAAGYGFFSIWLEVFKDYPEVISKIILFHKGTALNCFDPANNYAPLNRNLQDTQDPI